MFPEFCFQDHFHVSLIFIELVITEEWMNIIKSLSENERPNSVYIWLL